ncbi:MAG: ferritin-like domain-containing protein [Candidatus Limnocylindrales bacterium]
MASRRLSEELERPSVLAKFLAQEAGEALGEPAPSPGSIAESDRAGQETPSFGEGRAGAEAALGTGRTGMSSASASPAARQLERPPISAGVMGRRLRWSLVRLAAAQLDARQAWLGIALYFDRYGLAGWSRLFRDGSAARGRSADRILAYLATGGVPFRLPSSAGARTRYRSPMQAARRALRRKVRVSGRVEAAMGLALARHDYRTLQALAGCMVEQAAREGQLRQIVALISSGINLFEAELLLDRLA